MPPSKDTESSAANGDSSEGTSQLPAVSAPRRLAGALVGLALGAPFYLLLIDTLDVPELWAGLACAVLAALAFEAGREPGFAEAAASPAWLLRSWRAVVRVPADLGRLAFAVLAAMPPWRRRPGGGLRAVAFRHGDQDGPRDVGRRALAEAFGSISPNPIVIGVDARRDVLLVHQLRRSGDADSIDVMSLR
jgi:hypothetical protein